MPIGVPMVKMVLFWGKKVAKEKLLKQTMGNYAPCLQQKLRLLLFTTILLFYYVAFCSVEV